MATRVAERDADHARAGKLTIFFAVSTGAETRLAMLRAARLHRNQRRDVVVGPTGLGRDDDVDTLLAGMDVLSGHDTGCHPLGTLDLQAVLERKPAELVVDDLSRSNPYDARHPRRWQDVKELLNAGIDVLTTLDVQHLESANDIVFSITGTRVSETVPDRLFDDADEIVFVDEPRAERSGVFDRSSGLALREIALRRVAERVGDDLSARRRSRGDGASECAWNVNDGLLVCVGKDRGDEKVVRAAGLRARRSKAPWHAVYVETPLLQRLPESQRKRVLDTLKLAESLGARTATLAAGAAGPAIVAYAREHNLATVVLGRSSRLYSQGRLRRRLAEHVADLGPEIELMLISRRAATDGGALTAADAGEDRPRDASWPGYAWAFIASMAVSIATLSLVDPLDAANIVMLYLLAEVVVCIRYGRRAALASVGFNVLAFDYFYVPPRFSFVVNDFEYVPTFVVMMVVGLLVGQMTSSMRFQARVARYREQRARSLFEMARDLGRALSLEQVAEVGKRAVDAAFRTRSAVLVPRANGTLATLPIGAMEERSIDPGLARWAYDHGEAAGSGTDTGPASEHLYVPLHAAMHHGGVLAIESSGARMLMIPEQRQLLDTFAALMASAIERLHLVTTTQEAQVAIESERLRNSLLATLSHDLRTPLTSIVGMSEVLGRALVQEGSSQVRQALAITEQSLRSSALVKNLLDMARLQAGALALRREWQSIEELAESAIRSLEGALSGHPLHLKLPDDLPLVHGDGVLLERVLANLFENAAKYTPYGTTIRLTGWRNERDIVVEVSDEGPGLPLGDSDLFEKFTRGAKESSTPGVGLGLSICRAIVKAHGGTITGVNREPPGHGAVFTWSIPHRDTPVIGDLSDETVVADELAGSAAA